jgi:hypothetical protein
LKAYKAIGILLEQGEIGLQQLKAVKQAALVFS